MSAATVTSKGQITLPKSVRDRLGLAPGDRVEFVETSAGFLMLPAKLELAALRGILPRPRKPVSIETIQRTAIRAGRGA